MEEKGCYVNIIDMALVGSRNRHTSKEDSDLDVVFEYEDDEATEDYVFNEMNSPKCEIDGIEIDFNPVREEESGTIEEYLEKAHEYDEYVLGNLESENKNEQTES